MISEDLLEVLRCSACGGAPLALDVEEQADKVVARGSLMCPDCKRWYRVVNDIPSLMPPQVASNLRAVDERWARWRAAMNEFLSWREHAWADAEEARARREQAGLMHRRFVDFCALPTEPFRCLDVGCGTGHLADLLPAECCYVGIDPLAGGSAPGLAPPPELMPRPQRPVALVQGVAEDLPFLDDSFDAALIVGALDHCNDPALALAEVKRVLRPGGVLGVLVGLRSDESEGGLRGALRSLRAALSGGRGPRAGATHTFSFTLEGLCALVAEQFQVEASTVDESGRGFVRAVRAGGGAG